MEDLPVPDGDETRPLLPTTSQQRQTGHSIHPCAYRPCQILIHSIRTISPRSKINLLLIFVPFSLVAGSKATSPWYRFVFSLLAVLALGRNLSSTVTASCARLSPRASLGLKAIFENAIMILLSSAALRNNQARVVQLSIIGSILANSLLVFGCCFLAAGIKRRESPLETDVGSSATSLLLTATISLALPATLFETMDSDQKLQHGKAESLSHGYAVVLLGLFVVYLHFRLQSFSECLNTFTEQQEAAIEEQENRMCTLFIASIAFLILGACALACSNILVTSIDQVVASGFLKKRFIAMVIIPLLAEGPDRLLAIRNASNGKMKQAAEFVLGRNVQTALFITPLMILLGWMLSISARMTLHLGRFETVSLFLGVLLVIELLRKAKGNHLDGAVCLATYIMIAMAYQYLPAEE